MKKSLIAFAVLSSSFLVSCANHGELIRHNFETGEGAVHLKISDTTSQEEFHKYLKNLVPCKYGLKIVESQGSIPIRHNDLDADLEKYDRLYFSGTLVYRCNKAPSVPQN